MPKCYDRKAKLAVRTSNAVTAKGRDRGKTPNEMPVSRETTHDSLFKEVRLFRFLVYEVSALQGNGFVSSCGGNVGTKRNKSYSQKGLD